MDFRFQYRRGRPKPEQVRSEREREKDKLRRTRGLAIGMTIPLSMIAGPLGGWFIGAWLDRTFHTSYWVAVFVILGAVAGIKMVIDMLVKLGRE